MTRSTHTSPANLTVLFARLLRQLPDNGVVVVSDDAQKMMLSMCIDAHLNSDVSSVQLMWFLATLMKAAKSYPDGGAVAFVKKALDRSKTSSLQFSDSSETATASLKVSLDPNDPIVRTLDGQVTPGFSVPLEQIPLKCAALLGSKCSCLSPQGKPYNKDHVANPIAYALDKLKTAPMSRTAPSGMVSTRLHVEVRDIKNVLPRECTEVDGEVGTSDAYLCLIVNPEARFYVASFPLYSSTIVDAAEQIVGQLVQAQLATPTPPGPFRPYTVTVDGLTLTAACQGMARGVLKFEHIGGSYGTELITNSTPATKYGKDNNTVTTPLKTVMDSMFVSTVSSVIERLEGKTDNPEHGTRDLPWFVSRKMVPKTDRTAAQIAVPPRVFFCDAPQCKDKGLLHAKGSRIAGAGGGGDGASARFDDGRPQCELQKCARCKQARYCSTDCQKLHWKHGHKAQCNQIVG